MSLILEALRKSEQQRRMGESPTLVSESAWASRRLQPASTRRGRWLWLALVLLLAGAAAAAWYYGRPSMALVDATTQQPAIAAAPLQPPPPTAAASEPAPVTATPPAPLPSAPVAEPADGRESIHASAAAAQTTAAGDPSSLPPLTAAPAPPPLADPAPVIAVQQPASADPVVGVPVEAPVATQTPAQAAPVAANAPPPTVQAPTAQRPQGDLPYVYELPLPTRQALPTMQVSMLVWNADPARRFVILDGVRAGEGEAAGDSLTVLEIRREGVVLDFRGSRFLLPNGGL